MPKSPRFILVTGLSGAGKTQALHFFEDIGYYCVDNLPPALVPTFAELVARAKPARNRIAVCVDARTGEDLANLPDYLGAVGELGLRPNVLFLDSSDAVLLRRYSESRRRHPASPAGSIEEGIACERRLLGPIRGRADQIVDTSALTPAALRERIAGIFAGPQEKGRIVVSVETFGFKNGLPPDADMVFDVRFLPNPHYDEELRPKTGLDADVRDFVLNNETAQEFLKRLRGFLKFLLPQYASEQKSYLTIAIGCTGGRHRSVAIAQEVGLLLRDLQYEARMRHRDIERTD